MSMNNECRYARRYALQVNSRRQSGFVLVLSLVMLTVLTLIGVSSMNSANMELRATANAKQHQVAFNAVQSLLEYIISDQGQTPVVDFQISDRTRVQKVTTSIANASNLRAKVVLSGCSVGIGSSLEQGKGFSYNFFDIRATGSNATGTSTSIQGQGVRYPSASC